MHVFSSKDVPSAAHSIQSLSTRPAELRHKPFGASPEDGKYYADAVVAQAAERAPKTIQSAPRVAVRTTPPPRPAPRMKRAMAPIKDVGDLAFRKLIVKPLVYIYSRLGRRRSNLP